MSGATTVKGAIVGLDWWGVGPTEMAQATSGAIAVPVWDLRKRGDRHLIDSPIAGMLASRRMRSLRHQSPFDWILVSSPHRLTTANAVTLRRHASKLVGLLGDVPVGRRTISPGVSDLFDLFAVPDNDWELPGRIANIPRVVEPWGSTVCDPRLLSGSTYDFERVAFVGTAYPERVELARSLSRSHSIVTFGDWPSLPRIEQRPAASRLDTLRALRTLRALVVNAHHPQFVSGLNPQFFDFSAAGIPQFVVYAHAPHTAHFPLTRARPQDLREPVDFAAVRLAADSASTAIRENHLFRHTVERLTGC